MKTQAPLTPQQAINNFQLLMEVHPTSNTHEEYVATVREIAQIVLSFGIQGDDKHPAREQALQESLAEALAYIEVGLPELDDSDETITTSADDGPEVTFHYAKALRLITP